MPIYRIETFYKVCKEQFWTINRMPVLAGESELGSIYQLLYGHQPVTLQERDATYIEGSWVAGRL
jgi:hypothetical protein